LPLRYKCQEGKPNGNNPDQEKAGHMEEMNMQENARLVLGLRAAGWSEKKINDFLLYIETGEEQYKPQPDEKDAE